ncbi:MAG: CdaR family protein [Tissierellaceae bacterium]|nr:CdaR family protein [Tissierellaceae bacterium]
MGKGKNNLTLKIFSVIIAIILWSYVMGIKNPDWPREYRNVDVAFTNVEALDRQNLIVMDPQEAKINVSVIGKKSDMDEFTSDKIVARLDLSGYREGQTRIPVIVSLKDSASTVRITKYEPTDILVSIDKIDTKEMVVNIKTEGQVPIDYTIGDLVSKPQTILLRGPRSWINEVSEVFAVVKLDDRTTTTNITAPIQLRDGQGNDVVGIEKDPSVVDITIPIYRKATLPIEVVLENELPEEYVITEMTVTPDSIAIRGGNNVADLTSIKTQPIDVNLFLENPNLDVELDLLDNVELLEPNQRISVNATVERLATQEFEFEFSEIEFRKLHEDLLVEESNETFKVTVKATESIIDTLSKENIKPYIDLSNYSEGEYEVSIRIQEIKEVDIELIEPESLTINLVNR